MPLAAPSPTGNEDGAAAPGGRRTRPGAPARSLGLGGLTADEIAEGKRLDRYRALRVYRPRTRGDCAEGPRPCPWVSCRYHLYVDRTARGSAKVNFPGVEPWELEETCALDVADRGGATLEDVGRLLNVTMERARQIEEGALHAVDIDLRRRRRHGI